MLRLAHWMSRLGTETAFEVLAQARSLEAQGRDIVHLEIGEPDFATPSNIRTRAQRAMEEGWTHYTPSAGLPQARAAVAEHVSKSRDVKVDPEEVIIAPGAKPVICFALLALVNPKDEVIYSNPSWPIYESLIRFIGAKPVALPLREINNFIMDPSELKRLLSPKTRLLILNSPANPTGTVIAQETLLAIARLLARYPKVWILSDEIYSRIIYEGRHFSPLSLKNLRRRTILADGLSKTYAMTGWRVGYGVAPKPLIAAMGQLATNVYSCATSFAQIAAVEALQGPQDDADMMISEFRKRRDVMMNGLAGLPGFSCRKPQAAFYVFPNIQATKTNSKKLCRYFLNTAGVACLPGTSFGELGEGYLRFSYANSIENINKAMELMRQALKNLN